MNKEELRLTTQKQEIEKCKQLKPEYVKYLTLDISGTKMVQMNRLFRHDITPDTNPEIFETIKNINGNKLGLLVTEAINIENERRTRIKVIESCKTNYPEYFSKFSDYLNIKMDLFKLREIRTLFGYDITPDINPEIFETIKNSNKYSNISEIVHDCILRELDKRHMEKELVKMKEELGRFYKEEDIPSIDDYRRINIYSCNDVNGKKNFPDYIHIEVEILQGSLQDKIDFVKKYKKIIRDKVFLKKIYYRFGENAKFLELYEYKFYSKPTVGDSGIVIGLLKYQWKDI